MNFSLNSCLYHDEKTGTEVRCEAEDTFGYRILVLDDITDIVKIMSRFAHQEGFQVIKAESNVDAMGWVQDEEVFASLRMAFLDIEVGSESGLEVYKAIRTKSPVLPVIMMSGSACHKLLYPILAYDDYTSFVPKPFEIATIRHLMHEPLAWGGDVGRLLRSDPNLYGYG